VSHHAASHYAVPISQIQRGMWLNALDDRPIRIIHTPMTHDDHLRPTIDRRAIEPLQLLSELEVRLEQVLDT